MNKDNVPKSFQMPYSKESHKSLEGVQGKTEEGKYMILGKKSAINRKASGEGDGEKSAGGFTIGGDMNFYEWDYESSMQSKE